VRRPSCSSSQRAFTIVTAIREPSSPKTGVVALERLVVPGRLPGLAGPEVEDVALAVVVDVVVLDACDLDARGNALRGNAVTTRPRSVRPPVSRRWVPPRGSRRALPANGDRRSARRDGPRSRAGARDRSRCTGGGAKCGASDPRSGRRVGLRDPPSPTPADRRRSCPARQLPAGDASMSTFEVEQPILNGPFDEPAEHWQIEEGQEPKRIEGRRAGSHRRRRSAAGDSSPAAALA
jgi:hypothetical protein